MNINDQNINDELNLPLNGKSYNAFGLPLNYFTLFEKKIKNKIEIQKELFDFPVLSSIQKNNEFIVPDNYFDEARKKLEYNTELTNYPKLQTVIKSHLSDLDEKYKIQIQHSLTKKMELVNELKQYETLYALDKVNGFSVSENYFGNFDGKIKHKIHETNTSKSSVIETVLDFIFGKKIAFSFCLVLIIGFSFYFNQSPETIVKTGDCKTLACLEKREILNNNAISNLDEEQLIDLVDVNALKEQLNLKKQETDSLTDNSTILNNVNADELIDEL